MKLAAFHTLRNGLKLNAGPVTSRMRKVLETALTEELLASGVIAGVEVGSSDDTDRLLLALCSFSADVPDEEVCRAVERAWTAVAFHHWSAHAFLTDEGHVELQAAALDRPGGHFVSLHLVAQRVDDSAPRPASAPDGAVTVPLPRLGTSDAEAGLARSA